MGIIKGALSGAGIIVGSVSGGLIRGVGKLTNSSFIIEVGDGVQNSTEFIGEQIGNVAEGTWNVGAGYITDDPFKKEDGFSDIGKGIGNTAKAVGVTVVSTTKSIGNIAGGVMEGDETKWKDGLREVGKTVAVAALGVSVIDMADGIDVGDRLTNVETSSNSVSIDNPNTHGVDPHYVEGYFRSDGTYVEGYWRDGDGNTSVNLSKEDGGGWSQSNPDYKGKI